LVDLRPQLLFFSSYFFFRRKILGLIAFGLFGLAHIVEIIGKTFLSQPGPPHMFLRTKELASEFPGLYIHTDASYPSGHALRVIFLSTMIVFIILKSKKVPTYLKYFLIAATVMYCFLMVVSRVSLGEHWTTDVVGGSFLGLSFAFISLFFL
jgi:undecaprenyl-diphosphatase